MVKSYIHIALILVLFVFVFTTAPGLISSPSVLCYIGLLEVILYPIALYYQITIFRKALKINNSENEKTI